MSKADEGARSFSLILTQCEDGALHAELSEKLQALQKTLGRHAESFGKAKGAMTLVLDFEVDNKGTVQVEASIKLKEPKVIRPRTVFWQNAAANLLNENPKQQKLPLHGLPATKEPPRDVGAENRNAKDA